MKTLLCFALIFATLAAPACAESLTPSSVAENIRDLGPKATVDELDHAGQLDTVMNGIASGETVWVHLSHELAQGTDAGASIGLSVALAQALPVNPQAVLAVLDDGPVTGAGVVCSAPFIEPTAEELETYLKRAIPAVTGVSDTAQYPQRDACLQALQHIAQQAGGAT